MSGNMVNVQSNERMDLQDVSFIGGDMSEQHVRDVVANVFTDPQKTRSWIISGFGIDCPSGKQVRVTRGAAVLARRDLGTIKYGSVAVAGEATRIIDIGSYTPGTYGVYIRFEYIDGENESRVFWDPAGNGSEYSQAIDTRQEANWNLMVETSSRGLEWLKIGEVDQATLAAPTTGITDQRSFYFEGPIHNSYQSGWSTDGGGTANDRNADRATYGIKDFQTMFSAIRQRLEDINGRGLRAWYARDIGGLNIGFDANPVEDRLAIGDASFNLNFDGTDPAINFDTNDSLIWDRSENQLNLSVGGTNRISYRESNIALEGSTAVGLGVEANKWRDIWSLIGHFDDVQIKKTSDPSLEWDNTGVAVDHRRWEFLSGTAGTLELRSLSDVGTVGTSALKMTRSGNAVQQTNVLGVYLGLGVESSETYGIEVGLDMVPGPSSTVSLGATTKPFELLWTKAIRIKDTTASLRLNETAVASDGGMWRVEAKNTGELHMASLTSAGADSTVFLQADKFSNVNPAIEDLWLRADSAGGDVHLEANQIFLNPSTRTQFDQRCLFYDTYFEIYNSTASINRDTATMRADGDNFVIASVDNASAVHDCLLFTRDANGALESITVGDAGDTGTHPDILPRADGEGNIGSTSLNWGTVFSDYATVNKATINYESSIGEATLEFNHQDATNDIGKFRIVVDQDELRISSHQYSTPGNAFNGFKMVAKPGTTYDYEIGTLTLNAEDTITIGGVGSNPTISLDGIGRVKTGVASSGAANYFTFDCSVTTSGLTTARTINGSDASSNTGWIKFYSGTTAIYIPYWTGT